MAGYCRGVMEGGAGDGGLGEALGGTDGLIGGGEFLAVDVITGEVGFGAGLPGEVNGGAGASGNGDQPGGGLRREGVVEEEGDGGGYGAAELEVMAVEGDGADALGQCRCRCRPFWAEGSVVPPASG